MLPVLTKYNTKLKIKVRHALRQQKLHKQNHENYILRN